MKKYEKNNRQITSVLNLKITQGHRNRRKRTATNYKKLKQFKKRRKWKLKKHKNQDKPKNKTK